MRSAPCVRCIYLLGNFVKIPTLLCQRVESAHEGEGEPQSCLCQLKFAADFILCHTSALGCAPLSISAGERFRTESLRNFLLCLSLSPIFYATSRRCTKINYGPSQKAGNWKRGLQLRVISFCAMVLIKSAQRYAYCLGKLPNYANWRTGVWWNAGRGRIKKTAGTMKYYI